MKIINKELNEKAYIIENIENAISKYLDYEGSVRFKKIKMQNNIINITFEYFITASELTSFSMEFILQNNTYIVTPSTEAWKMEALLFKKKISFFRDWSWFKDPKNATRMKLVKAIGIIIEKETGKEVIIK